MSEKPLFIPLRREFFDDFERGEKTEEYRPFGLRWNHRTCRVGRRVVLSCGYGKSRRLTGFVAGFHISLEPESLPGWKECYGDRHEFGAVIKIKLEGKTNG